MFKYVFTDMCARVCAHTHTHTHTHWTCKSPGSKMPWSLGKLAFSLSVVAGGSCTLTYYLIQKAFTKTSYYQLALEQLHSHPEALEALGAPLNVHYLHLIDRANFVDIANAQLKPPSDVGCSRRLRVPHALPNWSSHMPQPH
ncbi:cytochrome c oxidase assembly factor 1 homolog isoform X3 [Ailuropoda melanoleuca]|uniref:cytochrome c oxidase assembly factor 1 homolog isoform X3 n=1 Tax=Ailuropoda melanoleuca TaxID=9646 RepID=UPI001494666C|nr:cytochrome c oxidase assembly factor 1 homolog isoform X3 [Ailuropoda melanoleuca]